MSTNPESFRKKATALFEEEKFKEIIELLTDEVLEKYKDAELYAWRARAHYRLNDAVDKIMDFAQKAIDTDTNYYMGYLARGSAWNAKGEYDKAIADYNKAIELKPGDAYAYNNRGNAWYLKGEYDKAMSDYNKTIELKPDDAIAYNNRGLVWHVKDEYDKATTDYNKTIELKPDYTNTYYNRGNLRRMSGKDLEESINDFEQFLKLIPDKEDIWAIRARDFIQELQEKLKDNELKEIGDLTSAIKKLLLITDGCITHYTGLSVTKILISDNANKFRISEGAFLNDTSEGTELFKFLQYKFFTEHKDGLVAETFAPKPFIGSFVAVKNHDDLNLWRFYGKENGVEAKGCALTIRMKEFIDAINQSLTKGNTKPGTSSEDDINFYRVAYLNHDSAKINFQIPNAAKKDETALNNLMEKLKDKVVNYQAKDRSILERYLNNIAFLFKSDVYKNENELRLVIKGIEFDKQFEMEPNPRVYIELINIRHLVDQITLGPKVDKPDEWAAAFYYSYAKETDEKKKPNKILISRLPYK